MKLARFGYKAKKILITLLIIAFILPTFLVQVSYAEGYYFLDDLGNRFPNDLSFGDFKYFVDVDSEGDIDTANACICGYSGTGENVVMPDKIGEHVVTDIIDTFYNNKKVKSIKIPDSVQFIGDSAFMGCDGLSSITIPASVSQIGPKAFYGCKGLKSITIPDSVVSIGDEAFSNCDGLTTIEIPKSTLSIGQAPFSGCKSLSQITVDENNPNFTGKDGVLFKTIHITDLTKEPELITVNRIGILVQLPGVKIDYKIPDGVQKIASCAFKDCEGLKNVTIPKSVESIGEHTFTGCKSLSCFEVDENNPDYASKDGVLFDKKLKTIIAFPNARKSYIIPNNVETISSAFYDCERLESITIPSSVTVISTEAFYGCKELKSITIPNSVKGIGGSAFYGCKELKSITIPNSVKDIGGGAFYDCRRLKSVTLPKSVTEIYMETFKGCSGLETITIPNSVTYIGDSAFEGCSGLKKISIPSNVKIIHCFAFAGCIGLKNVTIPKSVESILRGAFYNCSELTAAYFLGDAPSTDFLEFCQVGVFDGCAPGFKTYYISGKAGFANNPNYAIKDSWYGYKAVPISHPKAPLNFKVTVTGTIAIISWNGVVGATSYKVYYKKSRGKYTILSTSTPKVTITGLVKSTKYYFKVAAVNIAGQGAFTTELVIAT